MQPEQVEEPQKLPVLINVPLDVALNDARTDGVAGKASGWGGGKSIVPFLKL